MSPTKVLWADSETDGLFRPLVAKLHDGDVSVRAAVCFDEATGMLHPAKRPPHHPDPHGEEEPVDVLISDAFLPHCGGTGALDLLLGVLLVRRALAQGRARRAILLSVASRESIRAWLVSDEAVKELAELEQGRRLRFVLKDDLLLSEDPVDQLRKIVAEPGASA